MAAHEIFPPLKSMIAIPEICDQRLS